MADKVEQIAGIIGDPESWKVRELGGELVLVDVPGRPGAKQKMHKAEAIRLGLWKDEEREAKDEERKAKSEERKAQPQVSNKARRPTRNKSKE